MDYVCNSFSSIRVEPSELRMIEHKAVCDRCGRAEEAVFDSEKSSAFAYTSPKDWKTLHTAKFIKNQRWMLCPNCFTVFQQWLVINPPVSNVDPPKLEDDPDFKIGDDT